MDYQEAIHYITELQKNKGSDYSLEPVWRLCELAGRPDRNLSIVHIAGTNGKGSIGSYLGNIMAMSGYTVGRYVSPTLLDYRERIQRIQPAGWLSETEGDPEVGVDLAAVELSLHDGKMEDVLETGNVAESLLDDGKTEDDLETENVAESSLNGGKTEDDLETGNVAESSLDDGKTEDVLETGNVAESLLDDGKTEIVSCTGIITEYIAEWEVAEILTWLRSLAEQMETQEGLMATAFEIETVMAFLVMKRWNVDVAMIECGMGGKRDATNIITAPVLCLFSHIGLDHTAFLGETVEEITAEKAGILKRGCAAVSVKQDKSVAEVLQKICMEQEVPLSIADPQEVKQIQYDMQGTTFQYGGSVLKMGQQGTYQIENVVAAIEAAKVLRQLGYDRIREDTIRDAVACSRHRGRFECICEKPYVIVDGAHNPQAAAELRHSLEAYFPGERFTYICGVFRDKDYLRMMEEMLPLASRVYTVKPPGERGLPAELLSAGIAMWRESHEKKMTEQHYDHAFPVQSCHSVTEALDLAVQGSERILVFGSLSFLHEVYEYFHVTGLV